MTTYEVIDPLAGSRWQGELELLSMNLKINSLLCSVSENGAQKVLGLILHRDLVLFALQWAKSVNEDPVPEVLKCFELTEKWLEDEDSVTKEELYSTGDAAGAYANAAYAASCTYADAVAAAQAAAHAAAHTAFATYAAPYAVHAAYDVVTYASQGQMIVDYYTEEMTHESL